MGVEIFLIVLGSVVGGSMLFALILGFRKRRASTNSDVEPRGPGRPRSGGFFGGGSQGVSDDAPVLHVEHYLRKARLRAKRFADNPSVEILRQDDDGLEGGNDKQ